MRTPTQNTDYANRGTVALTIKLTNAARNLSPHRPWQATVVDAQGNRIGFAGFGTTPDEALDELFRPVNTLVYDVLAPTANVPTQIAEIASAVS